MLRKSHSSASLQLANDDRRAAARATDDAPAPSGRPHLSHQRSASQPPHMLAAHTHVATVVLRPDTQGPTPMHPSCLFEFMAAHIGEHAQAAQHSDTVPAIVLGPGGHVAGYLRLPRTEGPGRRVFQTTRRVGTDESCEPATVPPYLHTQPLPHPPASDYGGVSNIPSLRRTRSGPLRHGARVPGVCKEQIRHMAVLHAGPMHTSALAANLVAHDDAVSSTPAPARPPPAAPAPAPAAPRLSLKSAVKPVIPVPMTPTTPLFALTPTKSPASAAIPARPSTAPLSGAAARPPCPQHAYEPTSPARPVGAPWPSSPTLGSFAPYRGVWDADWDAASPWLRAEDLRACSPKSPASALAPAIQAELMAVPQSPRSATMLEWQKAFSAYTRDAPPAAAAPGTPGTASPDLTPTALEPHTASSARSQPSVAGPPSPASDAGTRLETPWAGVAPSTGPAAGHKRPPIRLPGFSRDALAKGKTWLRPSSARGHPSPAPSARFATPASGQAAQPAVPAGRASWRLPKLRPSTASGAASEGAESLASRASETSVPSSMTSSLSWRDTARHLKHVRPRDAVPREG